MLPVHRQVTLEKKSPHIILNTFLPAIAVLLLTSASNALFLTTEGSSFSNGLAVGKEGAETMWRKMGGDCGNIWDFQSDVDSMKGWAFPDSRNWRTKSYNRGARSGVCAIRYYEL